jgi:benzylsuccinate CoA-transferase BbsE subunit
MGPIFGLRVIEIGDLGEVAGKLLADAGADVVKVEPPTGARSRHNGPFIKDRPEVNGSLAYAYWNTSKRGVTLDAATAEGASIWRQLVEGADVVVDAMGVGALDGLGLGWDACSGNERLIWCSITPFGREGPWRDLKVNDLVSMALGGPVMSNGYDDHDVPPMRPEGNHSLAMAGEYACIGVMTALLHRHQTGMGQLVDVSIHEAVSCTTEGAFNIWEYNKRIVQRQTNRHAVAVRTQPWSLRCSDGRYVALMGGGYPRDARVWDTLLAWMEETGLAGDLAGRSFPGGAITPEERQEIVAKIHRFVESQPSEVVYRRGQACHLPWGLVRNPEENLDDPHWADREFFVEVELPGYDKPVRIPGPPYKFEKTPVEVRRRAPLLGEHNFEVYSGLGYTTEQLVSFSKAGAI